MQISTIHPAIKSNKQRSIYNVIKHLLALPKVDLNVEFKDGSISTIQVNHAQEYVPNFSMEWCPCKEHFRVYIHVASTEHGKIQAGYCICTIDSGLTAAGFCVLYTFLHKHRANNKTAA